MISSIARVVEFQQQVLLLGVVELAEDVVLELAVRGVDLGAALVEPGARHLVQLVEGALAALAGRARGRVVREVAARVVDLGEQLGALLRRRDLAEQRLEPRRPRRDPRVGRSS